TDDAVRNGNDAMLGFFSYESNQITNTSASLVTAMRQACKNICYTVVNSGNYTLAEETSGLDNMTSLFLTIDIAVAVALVLVEGIVLIRWRKKSKAAN
ncbi:MAG: beta-glucosidase, partial [Clostridiales bacterium]|nr:beta-glucosidase [Clostridiales bacterium]